jgi:hypothetical protein
VNTASTDVFIPIRFVASWVAGYALRERDEQAEAAEMRAAYAATASSRGVLAYESGVLAADVKRGATD